MEENFVTTISKLPKELQEIMMQNWDISGRPLSFNSMNNTVISVLKKNEKAGGQSFLNDMKLMFPHIESSECAIYYNVFIEGAKWIDDRLTAGKANN